MEIRDVRNLVSMNHGDWLSKFGPTWTTQIEKLKERFGDAVEAVLMPPEALTDIPIIYVKKDKIKEVLQFLKNEPGFDYNFLTDYTATDEMPAVPRFEIVVQLFSTQKHWRIRIKVKLSEGEEFPTLISIWPGANWCERELWDMFGIRFTDHPDLRRILMDERWEGHPLRKDYPLKGYQIFPTPEPIDENLLK